MVCVHFFRQNLLLLFLGIYWLVAASNGAVTAVGVEQATRAPHPWTSSSCRVFV